MLSLLLNFVLLFKSGNGNWVLDFSDDNDHKNDTNSEFTSASIDIKDVSPIFTICSAFMVKRWTPNWFGLASMVLSLSWSNDGSFLQINLDANRTDVLLHLKTESSNGNYNRIGLFPRHWVQICLSIDKLSGSLIIVVDGQKLNQIWSVGLSSENKASDMALSLGSEMNPENRDILEHSVILTDINIFSSILSLEEMYELTTPGAETCAKKGDLLSWEESRPDWKLFSKARVLEIDYKDSPCTRVA